jgi:hypothetical protein
MEFFEQRTYSLRVLAKAIIATFLALALSSLCATLLFAIVALMISEPVG